MAINRSKHTFGLHVVTSLVVLAIVSFGIVFAIDSLKRENFDARSTAVEFPAVPLTRILAFQSDTMGATDWSDLDAKIHSAKQDGKKVALVLESDHDESWYISGFKIHQSNCILSYPEYVKAVVRRYKDQTAIYGWVLTSRSSAPSSFLEEMSGMIKSIDPIHPVLDAREGAK